jgi:hypothetical protein
LKRHLTNWASSQGRAPEDEFAPEGPLTGKIKGTPIASAESYHCPEPVLLIIGGDPQGSWTAHPLVCLANGETIELNHERTWMMLESALLPFRRACGQSPGCEPPDS